MDSKDKTEIKQQWVTSSFDALENTFTDTCSAKLSRKALMHEPVCRKNVQNLWVEKYAPRNKEELAVHKKKIAEIEEWLKNYCCSEKDKQSSILLLSGPAGSGKTSTVQVLCRQLKIEIKEWINPIILNKQDMLSDGIGKTYQSQIKIFEEFILRAGKYPSLTILGKDPVMKRIILTEDFPNVFSQNSNDFHQILRQFHHMKRCCAVFIMSDNNAFLNIKNLFPQKLQEELRIKWISFNPISATNMLRILNKVAAAEISPLPEKNLLESLAQLVSGDIRMALNTLQFSFSTGHDMKISSHPTKKTSKKPSIASTAKKLTANEKDTSLFILHALGKILHCKRALDQPTDEESLPSCLRHTARHPLLTQPEEIIHNLSMSSEVVILFLHQNYHTFFCDIENIMNAAQYLSDSDILTSEWTGRNALEECAALVAVQGLMYSNCSTTGMGWHPIYKPYWFTANKLISSRNDDLCHLHQDFMLLERSLLTDIVPYHHLMKLPYKSAESTSICHHLCSFSNICHRAAEEPLQERDVLNEMEPLVKDECLPVVPHSDEVINLDDDEFDISEYSD